MGTGSGPAPWAGLEHVDAVSVGRVFLEYGPDPVFGMQDGVFVWVSGPVEELLGWSPGELIGMDSATVLHPSDEAEMQALAMAIMEDGKASAVVRVRSRRGDFAWIEVSAQLIPSEHDSIQVIGTMHSAQRFAEAREGLARTEERFRLAMENAPAGMAVVAPDGAFVLVNDALCSLLDRPRGELLTMRWQEVTHPDDLLNEVDLDGQVHSGHIDRYRLRKRYLRPDGQVVWADVSVGTVRDLDGALEYHVKSIVDVTSRVATENELARLSRQYQVLAENVADVAYLFGPDGIATWVSPNVEAALGWSAPELIGTSLFDLIHPDDQAWVRGLRARAMSGVDPEVPDEGWVLRMRRKDGSYLWMSQRTRVVHDDTGGVRELVGSLRDVDALVQARHRAESASSFMHAAMDAQSDPLVILRTLHEPGTDVGDCLIVEANHAAITALDSSTAVIGERWSTCTKGLTYLPTALDVLTDLRRDGTYTRDEVEVSAPQGTTRFVDVRAALIDSDNLTLTWRDVTARRDAAAATTASELRYRLLAENVSDVVMHLVGTSVSWVSPSVTPVFGGTPEDWRGRDVTDFVHPDNIPDYHEDMIRVTDQPFVRRRVRIRDLDGVYHWVDSNARLFREDDGSPNGFIASLRIVDDLVAAEAELDRTAPATTPSPAWPTAGDPPARGPDHRPEPPHPARMSPSCSATSTTSRTSTTPTATPPATRSYGPWPSASPA